MARAVLMVVSQAGKGRVTRPPTPPLPVSTAGLELGLQQLSIHESPPTLAGAAVFESLHNPVSNFPPLFL